MCIGCVYTIIRPLHLIGGLQGLLKIMCSLCHTIGGLQGPLTKLH